MKALFLVFHGFSDFNGISKKIFYQVDALRQCGVDTHLCHLKKESDSTQKRMVDDIVIDDMGKGVFGKIKKRICYNKVAKYILENNIDLLYIRSVHNSNPFITRMVRKVHQKGVKVVMEIPTYPYEEQYKGAPLMSRIGLKIDILSRDALAKNLDYIVSFTDYDKIFGVKNIPISNGIDFDKTPVKKSINNTSKRINLIGVAEIHFWHAFDRVIEGLAKYYAKPQDTEVIFHIVGTGGADLDLLKELTTKYGLERYIVFHGTKSGSELDDIFNQCDMGIASLGRHRSGITKIKTLKNREYAARGIPFIYSEIDDDFETMPYIIKAPADESPIDIERIIDFYRANKLTPQEIRDSIVSTLSWKTQMQKILDKLK